jgi:hypothetical protein
MQVASKKLSVSAILLGILGGIIGLAAGLSLGFALGAILARVLHISSFEGGAGYFAVAIASLVTVLVVPVAILLTLYWRGIRGIWLFIGLVIVCASMFAIGASGLGIWYAAQPHVLNLNGPTPLLEFEVKPPEGQSVENLANVEPELDTDRNSMPGTWRTEAPETPGVRGGYVEMYFRTSRRLFVLKFPGDEDRIFNLHLPANPMKSKYRSWSEWQKTNFVAKADQQPARFSGETIIRFVTEWITRTGRQVETAALQPGICRATKRWKAGLRQFHPLEEKTISLSAGLRLRLAGYLGICRSPRRK